MVIHAPALQYVPSPFYIRRHNCGATRLLNIIIYLYCKSSKPYFVCNNSGNDQCFSYSFLFLTRQHQDLVRDYRHSLLNLSTNCTGNSIFTLQSKVARSLMFLRKFEVFQMITGTDWLCACTTMHICSTNAPVIMTHVNMTLFYTGPLLNAFFTKHMHRHLALHPVLCPGIQGLAPR